MRTGLIALVVAAAAGSASAVVVSYDFETGLAAQGWSQTSTSATTFWTDLPGPNLDGNYVNGSNNAPIANNDRPGPGLGAFDASLISPGQPFVGAAVLSYQINFQSFSGLDFAQVYYGNTLVFTHTTDTPVGGLYSLGAGVGFSHNVTATPGDAVRFRFSTTDSDPWEWYAQVDNVIIDGVIPAPASLALIGLGGLVAGRRRR